LSRNHPGFPNGVRGKTLLARMRRQAAKYGARIEAARVEDLQADGDAFRLVTETRVVAARRVVLATGVVDVEPEIPGVEPAIARGLVRVCPICDGYETIGQQVGVLGRDAHAAREAIFLTTYTSRVTLIHGGPPEALPESERVALAQAGVDLIEAPIDGVALDRKRIAAVCFSPGRTVALDCVYAALGVIPRSDLAVKAGAKLDAGGRLFVTDQQETSAPGLYAAGDVVRGLNQISTAEGEGATAATHLHNALRGAAG
jgi:thioredoxin reductase (NADPH)